MMLHASLDKYLIRIGIVLIDNAGSISIYPALVETFAGFIKRIIWFQKLHIATSFAGAK